MTIKIEDEYKFLVVTVSQSTLDGLDKGVEIVQGYLLINPLLRVRIEDAREGSLTTKRKLAPGKNLETTEEIPLSLANQMMPFHKYNQINKIRHRIGRLELDIFQGILSGLVLLEFEKNFPEEQCEIPPGFEVKDVTGDERFENHNLCQLDRLPEEWRCQRV